MKIKNYTLMGLMVLISGIARAEGYIDNDLVTNGLDIEQLKIILGALAVLLLVLVLGISKSIRLLAESKLGESDKAIKKSLLFLPALLMPVSHMHLGVAVNFPFDSVVALLMVLDFVLLVVLIVLMRYLKEMAMDISGQTPPPSTDFIEKINIQLTKSVAIENEKDILMDHNYDGIRELDNVLPPWWVYMFYATIIFGVIYAGYYHIGSGQSQAEEYATQVVENNLIREAYNAKMANEIDENNVPLLTSEAVLNKGLEIYSANCVSCHGNLGQGGIGPNLTDPNWLHGGSTTDIFRSVKYGIPDKGMIAWGDQLLTSDIHAVSSYIKAKLSDTNVSGGKAPQGEVYLPKEALVDTAGISQVAPQDANQ